MAFEQAIKNKESTKAYKKNFCENNYVNSTLQNLILQIKKGNFLFILYFIYM